MKQPFVFIPENLFFYVLFLFVPLVFRMVTSRMSLRISDVGYFIPNTPPRDYSFYRPEILEL